MSESQSFQKCQYQVALGTNDTIVSGGRLPGLCDVENSQVIPMCSQVCEAVLQSWHFVPQKNKTQTLPFGLLKETHLNNQLQTGRQQTTKQQSRNNGANKGLKERTGATD